jgi:hypothetical protein
VFFNVLSYYATVLHAKKKSHGGFFAAIAFCHVTMTNVDARGCVESKTIGKYEVGAASHQLLQVQDVAWKTMCNFDVTGAPNPASAVDIP